MELTDEEISILKFVANKYKAEDTEGCILVGMDSDWMDGWLGNSRVTYDKLFPKIESAINSHESVWIKIT